MPDAQASIDAMNETERGATHQNVSEPASATASLTFLFSDIEGSTKLWERYSETMPGVLATHDRLLGEAVVANRGHVVKSTGDGIMAVFVRAVDGLAAAIAGQRAIAAESWREVGGLRVRMAVHTGEVTQRDGDYFGATLNRVARLLACAHGGQMLCTSLTADLAMDGLPPGVGLIELGEHALRDLIRHERVYQVTANGLPAEFPPILSVSAHAGNIPAPAASFIGRQADFDAIGDLVGPSRIVCITGVGGVGKTRLALEVANAARSRFVHGAWFCDLSAVVEPEKVLDIVIATLEIKSSPGRDPAATVVDSLRHKKLLLVLDNCEHVLEPIAQLAEQIRDSCPGVCLLATSRERLGVAGEHVWPLKPLAIASALQDAKQSDAVRLFVDRARDARPDFALTDRNEAAVVDVCRRLDGLPLAIELAAARVAVMTPNEISSLLEERFRLLKGTQRRVERHQTLRAAIEWSYSLLDGAERAIFTSLGAFSGSFDADAATAVASDGSLDRWEVLDALQSLAAKSMVVADVGDEATSYTMLETLRSFARDLLKTADPADDTRRRHAEYFASVAEREGPRHVGPDEVASQERIVASLDNLRAATFWSLDRQDEHSYALRIIAALCGETTANKVTGVGAWAERAVEFLDEVTPGRGAAILGAAAWRAIDRGDFSRAGELAARAYEHCFDADCPHPALAPSALALVRSTQSVAAAIEVMAHTARTLEERPGEEVSVAMNYSGLASFSSIDPAERENALMYAERCRELALASGSMTAQIVATTTLGQVYLARGDARRALDYLDESIELTQKGASDMTYPMALRGASRAASRLGQWARSAGYIQAMVHYGQHAGDERTILDAFGESIVLLTHAGRLHEAVALEAYTKATGLSIATFGWFNTARKRSIARAKEALPDAEFAAADRRGAAMTFADVIAMVTTELDALAGATPEISLADG